jgi:phosphatidate cytidylyltransferase
VTPDLFQLRDWTVGEKVGLLFVILFGLLLLLSVTSLVVMLRESNEAGEAYLAHQERRQRRLRDLRALWVGAVTFWLAWVSGPVGSTIVFAAFSFLALREYITLTPTRRGDHRSLILAFFFVTPLQYLFVGLRAFDLFTVFVPVYVFLAIPVVSALAGDPERFLERNAKIQWGITVCVYGLAHAPALLLLEFKGYEGRGAFLLFFLVMTTVAGQLLQEFVGRRRRGRPVARKIDRGFSLRAFGLGVAAAAGVGAALFWITPVEPWRALVMGAVAGACGSLGDLVMRALKKDAGVPSWGNLNSITGAVGLLDRVAPLCFAAPVFFHSVRWYFV